MLLSLYLHTNWSLVYKRCCPSVETVSCSLFVILFQKLDKNIAVAFGSSFESANDIFCLQVPLWDSSTSGCVREGY